MASIEQQTTQIAQLQDSLAGTIASLRSLESESDSLTALNESRVLSLISARDSLATVGILYTSASSSNTRQIIKISSLRDSLGRSTSYGHEMVTQFDSLMALKDSLVTLQGQSVDIIASQRGAMGNLRGEIQMRDSLLAGVRDSLSASVGREANLQARHDSLTTLKNSLAAELDQAMQDLAAAASTEQTLRNEINILEVAFQGFENQVASGAKLSGIYDQVKTAVIAVKEEKIDADLDAQYLAQLNELVAYKSRGRGLGRLRGGGSEVQTRYKMQEFRQYLSWAKLRGNTPEALNLLAATYYEQKDEVRGALTYLKTIFIYTDSPASEVANGSLGESLKEGAEIALIYNEVALNPKALEVGDESVYRYFNFLEKIRGLQHADARSYFLEEAYQFLTFYPHIYNVDLLYTWTAETYHALEEYDTEILTYLKMRSLFSDSEYRAQITFDLAEVTTKNLGNHQLGADRYAIFLEEFSAHDLAPQALIAQANLYQSELKQPEKAGELYRSLADAYATHELAPTALFAYAELLEGKLKSPPEALLVYQEVLSEYGTDEGNGVRALEALADLSNSSRQYDAAVIYYLEIFTRFPGAADQVVDGLMEAAEIYEGRLKNLEEALKTLQIVMSNYPKHGKVKTVQKRILKLQKEIG